VITNSTTITETQLLWLIQFGLLYTGYYLPYWYYISCGICYDYSPKGNDQNFPNVYPMNLICSRNSYGEDWCTGCCKLIRALIVFDLILFIRQIILKVLPIKIQMNRHRIYIENNQLSW
jgi:hypothetical protein